MSDHPVAIPNQAFQDMSQSWELLDDLLGGTLQMRKRASKWLPQEPKEGERHYQLRVNRSFLFNAYKSTLHRLASRPFKKPVDLTDGEKLSERMIAFANDMDGTGLDKTGFASRMLFFGMHHGIVHVLVDNPRREDGQLLTLADDERTRPYASIIPANSLIGWRVVDGELDMIRIREVRTLPDGDYGEKIENIVRVYRRDSWEIWVERKETDDVNTRWFKESEGPHDFGRVPLVTLQLGPDGFMRGVPVLEELGWLNLAHFQSSSDQRNILRYIRMPLLVATAFRKEDLEKNRLVVGPNQLIFSENQEASIRYVEHTGAGIEAGERDLKHLEAQMEVVGLQPLMEKQSNVTATGSAIAETQTSSALQNYVQLLEAALYDVFALAAEWLNETLPEQFDVNVFSDFNLAARSEKDIDILVKMWLAHGLDVRTMLLEVKRRGLLAEDINIDDVMQRIESQAPSFSVTPPNADDDE